MTGAVPVADLVAREIRAVLGRRRMSHADLARLAQLSPTTVNRVLGGGAITLDVYVAMMTALGTPSVDTVRMLVGYVVRSTPATPAAGIAGLAHAAVAAR